MIIKALMSLYSDEVSVQICILCVCVPLSNPPPTPNSSPQILQLEGLKMIQTLSKTAEGWKQISDTRGGWQALTQGMCVCVCVCDCAIYIC